MSESKTPNLHLSLLTLMQVCRATRTKNIKNIPELSKCLDAAPKYNNLSWLSRNTLIKQKRPSRISDDFYFTKNLARDVRSASNANDIHKILANHIDLDVHKLLSFTMGMREIYQPRQLARYVFSEDVSHSSDEFFTFVKGIERELLDVLTHQYHYLIFESSESAQELMRHASDFCDLIFLCEATGQFAIENRLFQLTDACNVRSIGVYNVTKAILYAVNGGAYTERKFEMIDFLDSLVFSYQESLISKGIDSPKINKMCEIMSQLSTEISPIRRKPRKLKS